MENPQDWSQFYDQELVINVREALGGVGEPLFSLLPEVLQRWHVAQQASQRAEVLGGRSSVVEQPEQFEQHGPGTFAASRIKIQSPEKFSGDAKQLSNYLFTVQQYVQVMGISNYQEQMKLALTLLWEKALTWWRSVADELWPVLRICSWSEFAVKLSAQLKDLHHVMRQRGELNMLRQTTSVQEYNSKFRNLYLELRTKMSDSDLLLIYLNAFKMTIQQQTMIARPTTLDQTMLTADRADSTIWFAGGNQNKPQKNSGGFGKKNAFEQGGYRPGQGSDQFEFQRQPSGTGPVPMDMGFAGTRYTSQPKGKIIFYYCGQEGHVAKSCPSNTRNVPFSRDPQFTPLQYNFAADQWSQQPPVYAPIPPPLPPPKNF